MKIFSKTVYDKADKLLSASKNLDYKAIAQHDSQEVEKLRAVMSELDIASPFSKVDNTSSKQTSQQPTGSQGSVDDADFRLGEAAERRSLISQQLKEDGMDDRGGCIYSSLADNRRIEFNQVPHKRGIPPFDMVVAPDFAPSPGLHGIFITASEVLSIVLPIDNDSGEWTILKRKGYESAEEMSEFLMLLSAGFDLPE